MVYLATNYDLVDFVMKLLIGRCIEDFVPIRGLTIQMKNFSLFQNVRRLISVRKGDEKLDYIDKIKLSIVFFALMSHCASCFDTPYGLYVIRKLYHFWTVLNSISSSLDVC